MGNKPAGNVIAQETQSRWMVGLFRRPLIPFVGQIMSRITWRMATSFVALGAAVLTIGCGGTSTPSAKAIPAEYRILAENVAMVKMKRSPDQFYDNQGMAEAIAEGHAEIMAIRGVKSSDGDITYIAEQAQDALSEAIKHLERINSLPKPDDMAVSYFIDGLFFNFPRMYGDYKDADEKQTALKTEFQALIAALDKLDAAQQLLPKIAEKYSATFCDSTERIAIDFQESWGSFGPHDWCSFLNRGAALQDCTLVVQLTGASGEVRTNVHFLKDWPANSRMYSRYSPGEEILGRTVGCTSVHNVKQLDVTIYSPQFATLIKYVYEGPEKDKHIATLCKDLKFTGRYQPFVGGTFWDTERGAYFTLDGVAIIPKCQVVVTFRHGSQSKGWRWDFDYWGKGDEKQFEPPKGELTFDPDNIDLTVSFSGANYQHHATIAVK
jgi:hypothetical protein